MYFKIVFLRWPIFCLGLIELIELICCFRLLWTSWTVVASVWGAQELEPLRDSWVSGITNSLVSGRCGNNFENIIVQITIINGLGTHYEMVPSWAENTTNEKSTLVLVMAWCYVMQQAIAWANVDLDLCGHMASLGCSELKRWFLNIFIYDQSGEHIHWMDMLWMSKLIHCYALRQTTSYPIFSDICHQIVPPS